MERIPLFNKDVLDIAKDDINLFFFEDKRFSYEHMLLVNNIVEALKNVKVSITN